MSDCGNAVSSRSRLSAVMNVRAPGALTLGRELFPSVGL